MSFFNIFKVPQYLKEIKHEKNNYINTHCIPIYMEKDLEHHMKALSDNAFLKWYDHWYNHDIPLVYFPDGSYAPQINVAFHRHGIC